MLDGIKNYLSMDSTGALMVSREWGCGKTYHIEKVVIPALQQEGWNPVKVSLFGIESINEIPLRIADNYKRPESDEVVKPKMDGNYEYFIDERFFPLEDAVKRAREVNDTGFYQNVFGGRSRVRDGKGFATKIMAEN